MERGGSKGIARKRKPNSPAQSLQALRFQLPPTVPRALLCLSKPHTGTSTHTFAMATNATTTHTKLTIAHPNRHMITTKRMITTLIQLLRMLARLQRGQSDKPRPGMLVKLETKKTTNMNAKSMKSVDSPSYIPDDRETRVHFKMSRSRQTRNHIPEIDTMS